MKVLKASEGSGGTVKVHFSVCEKIMQIGQNGPLEKFTHFLFMRLEHCMHYKHMAR